MITVTIRQAARRRGIKNAYQFARSVGFAKMVGSRIWDGAQDPKLKTLDKICEAWGCDLSELIRHTRKNGARTPDRHKRPK